MRPYRPDPDKLKAWGAKWANIRDNATTPAIRSYAEQYLDMLRRQLKAEYARLKDPNK